MPRNSQTIHAKRILRRYAAWAAFQIDGSGRLLPNWSLTDIDYKLRHSIGLEVCGYSVVSTRADCSLMSQISLGMLRSRVADPV